MSRLRAILALLTVLAALLSPTTVYAQDPPIGEISIGEGSLSGNAEEAGSSPGSETPGETGNPGGEETTEINEPGGTELSETGGSSNPTLPFEVAGTIGVSQNAINALGPAPQCAEGEFLTVEMQGETPTAWVCRVIEPNSPVVLIIVNPSPSEPCAPELLGAGNAAFNCPGDSVNGFSWGWALNVYAIVPPHVVERQPFPRGLVTLPNTFMLRVEPAFALQGGPNGPGGEGGFWSNTVGTREQPIHGGEFGVIDGIANYRLGLRWRRVYAQSSFGPVEPTCWFFDERSWNLGQDYGYGSIENTSCNTWPAAQLAYHTYETSSYDLLANGPRADLAAGTVPSWDLQSYQVKVPTFWQGEWAAEWEVAREAPCPADGQVGERPAPPDPDPTDEVIPTPEPVCVAWQKERRDWAAIDLRRYGYPKPWYVSYKVTECGFFGGREWCQEIEEGTVPTPIIESQPVIVE
ncbi:MAG: hypothetical protein Kow00120_15240 [Anaerolineae bacterium]